MAFLCRGMVKRKGKEVVIRGGRSSRLDLVLEKRVDNLNIPFHSEEVEEISDSDESRL